MANYANVDLLPLFSLSPKTTRHGSIEAAVLATQGAELPLGHQFIEVFQRQVLRALTYLLHLGTEDVVVVLKEGAQAMLYDVTREQCAHSMATTHDLGSAQRLLHLLAGTEADTLYHYVLTGDAVLQVLGFLESQLEAERPYLVHLHRATIE